MCVVIDSCCLAMVFDSSNEKHLSFIPILDWINGSGCMIYGGSKYNLELRRLPKYLSLVAELRKTQRAIPVPDAEVDSIAVELKKKFPNPEFNDEHIAALVIASRCGVVCTIDKPATAYLRSVEVFTGRDMSRPSIYSGHRDHKKLCCNQNLVGICRKRA